MKKIINLRLLTAITLMGGLTACSSDNKKELEIPATYTFERDGASTVSYGGQTTRIAMATELISAMSDFNNTSDAVLNMYKNENNPFADAALNSSTKTVRSKVAASKDFFSSNATEGTKIKTDFETWIAAQYSETAVNKDQLATAGSAGQIADGTKTRYVNAQGLEYNQAVNKSLIGALMLDQMLNNYLSPAVLDEGSNRADNDAGTVADGKSYTTMEHKWDEAYGYLFGASASGASPLATLGDDDKFLNKYLGRVNGDNDFNTYGHQIYDAFKKGRAAIVAGDYSERDKQADIIKELASAVIGVRAVYYLQAGKAAKASGDLGGAFHDLSEGFGFIYSLRFTRKPGSSDPYLSKSEVDGFISKLTTGNGFWDVSGATLDEISEDIASKFDFTVAQAAN